jgi:hypothetical protein
VKDVSVLDTSGGSILLSIPFAKMQNLETFFKLIEQDFTNELEE